MIITTAAAGYFLNVPMAGIFDGSHLVLYLVLKTRIYFTLKPTNE